jgi:hypothetical protein
MSWKAKNCGVRVTRVENASTHSAFCGGRADKSQVYFPGLHLCLSLATPSTAIIKPRVRNFLCMYHLMDAMNTASAPIRTCLEQYSACRYSKCPENHLPALAVLTHQINIIQCQLCMSASVTFTPSLLLGTWPTCLLGIYVATN